MGEGADAAAGGQGAPSGSPDPDPPRAAAIHVRDSRARSLVPLVLAKRLSPPVAITLVLRQHAQRARRGHGGLGEAAAGHQRGGATPGAADQQL
jgi:hypothetical protein